MFLARSQYLCQYGQKTDFVSIILLTHQSVSRSTELSQENKCKQCYVSLETECDIIKDS